MWAFVKLVKVPACSEAAQPQAISQINPKCLQENKRLKGHWFIEGSFAYERLDMILIQQIFVEHFLGAALGPTKTRSSLCPWRSHLREDNTHTLLIAKLWTKVGMTEYGQRDLTRNGLFWGGKVGWKDFTENMTLCGHLRQKWRGMEVPNPLWGGEWSAQEVYLEQGWREGTVCVGLVVPCPGVVTFL